MIKANIDNTEALKTLEARTDSEAARIRRYMAMPDLSRKQGSPLKDMVERIVSQDAFQKFDIIETSEIQRTDVSFDLFDFPADHPAKSPSDTYYIDDEHILRTHTTVMWHDYLADKGVQERMKKGESVGSFSFGKVYRKDEIDRHHMNVFHQIDGWYLARKDSEKIGQKQLEEVLVTIAQAVFGPDIEYRFNPDTFPYTDPSIEMEIKIGDRWVEILGSGVVKGKVLDNHGVDSSVWNGWAFGFGLERLAIISMDLPDIRLLWSEDDRVKKQLKLNHTFVPVSKFPPVPRDISFIVEDSTFVVNDYFDLIRDIGGDLVEEVSLSDRYENEEKFGAGKISYTYRIVYRSLDRTLTNEEVEEIQNKLYEKTAEIYKAELR